MPVTPPVVYVAPDRHATDTYVPIWNLDASHESRNDFCERVMCLVTNYRSMPNLTKYCRTLKGSRDHRPAA